MNEHERRMLTAWFDANEVRGSDPALGRAMAAAKGRAQRPGWVVRLRGGTIAADEPGRISLAVPLLAGGALIAALVTGAIVGGLVTLPPNVSPAPPSLTPVPSPTLPSVLAGRDGLVAYTHVLQLERGVDCPDRVTNLCYERRLWVANPDGSNPRALVPTVAGYGGQQAALGWSPDGRWLLFEENGVPKLTDASGSDVRTLDVPGSRFAFSPDSTRLAFDRAAKVDGADAGELAILDIASGRVAGLNATRSIKGAGNARWSPDGAWIVYDRQGLDLSANVFLVRPDGTDVRALTIDALHAIDPDWSPDGSTLAFTSSVLVDRQTAKFASDIYTLALDDRNPIRLTNDTISARPAWTLDGRIVFIRIIDDGAPGGTELWVMDADGSDPERLDASNLAALTEIGCVACIYPPAPPGSELEFLDEAFWQPTP